MNRMPRTTDGRFDQDHLIRTRRIGRELDRILGDEKYPQPPDFVIVWRQRTPDQLRSWWRRERPDLVSARPLPGLVPAVLDIAATGTRPLRRRPGRPDGTFGH